MESNIVYSFNLGCLWRFNCLYNALKRFNALLKNIIYVRSQVYFTLYVLNRHFEHGSFELLLEAEIFFF